MNYLMICKNESCSYEGQQPYAVCIPGEAVLDDKNVAAAYCPYCNGSLDFKYQEGTQTRVTCAIE